MNPDKIQISYTGCFPNLCSGKLTVTIDGTKYEFPENCMKTNGSCVWNPWTEETDVESGDWYIVAWPSNFPKELMEDTLTAVRRDIEPGCCGGCI